MYNVNDDLLVLAGDNLYDFEIAGFIEFLVLSRCDSVMVHPENDRNMLIITGVAELKNGKLVSFEEKPANPRGKFEVPPFYIYRKDTLPLIKRYIESEQPFDSPGSLIAWLIKHIEIRGYLMPGKRYDIGDLKSYEEAKRIFEIKK